MKFSAATLALFLLNAASTANAYTCDGCVDCDYNPTHDVTDHSKSAVDVNRMTAALLEGNNTLALEIYQTTTIRSSSSLEDTSMKDWAAGGAPTEIFEDYQRVLGENPHHLHSHLVDAINCDGVFEGKSSSMCSTYARKNVVCSTLSIAIYEWEKAHGGKGSEKNWDEGFAYWNGLYEEAIDGTAIGGDSTGYIQFSRDGNFQTGFKKHACDAMKAGQNKSLAEKKEISKDIYNAIVSTFSQAILKYAVEMLDTTANQDAKWGEGYAYFRCAAGLFDEDFSAYVEENFSPLTNDFPTDNSMYCGIAKKMSETEDLGYGVNMGDLQITTFDGLKDIETTCSITIPEETSTSGAAALRAASWVFAAGAALFMMM